MCFLGWGVILVHVRCLWHRCEVLGRALDVLLWVTLPLWDSIFRCKVIRGLLGFTNMGGEWNRRVGVSSRGLGCVLHLRDWFWD